MAGPLSRERNQNWFLFQFKEARKYGKKLTVKKLLALFSTEMMAANRTGKEILGNMEALGRIKIVEGRIEVLK